MSCTSRSYSWNKSAKCVVEPKKIKDIATWKKITSKSNNGQLDT